MHKIILQRAVGKRTSDEKIKTQVAKIVTRALGGNRGRTWSCNVREIGRPYRDMHGMWIFTYQLIFEKTSGPRDAIRANRLDVLSLEQRQFQQIREIVEQTGQNAAFAGQNWLIKTNAESSIDHLTTTNTVRINQPQPINNDHIWEESFPELASLGNRAPNLGEIEHEIEQIFNTPKNSTQSNKPASLSGVVSQLNHDLIKMMTDAGVGVSAPAPVGPVKTWKELVVPPELLGLDSDRHLAQHPAWKDLYGVNPQVRLILSNIKRAQQTNGDSRNHAVLFGHSGCGKTTTMFCLEKMYGKENVLKLDATSTTKAGLEKLFFSDLKDKPIPPLVFMEEAEKANPEALKIWLGALDDRGEIRKINARENQLCSVKVLFFCTVNNKSLFDQMMGSDGTEPGALSSRCVTQVYYPRPNESVLRQILQNEIKNNGGETVWIDPVIEMAKTLNVTDSRIVRSYLAGGDRLLDGSYQRDWMAVNSARLAFNKNS